jgi:uncharacterized peroxidase-related enzyme
MPRIQPIAPETAPATLKPAFDQIAAKLGGVPNLMRTFAASPAVLEAYLGFSGALGKASLSPAEREAIALVVAGQNACEYCAAAHTAIGKRLSVDAGELAQNLGGRSSAPRTQALLDLAAEIVEKRGQVSDASVARLRAAGLGDRELAELVAVVALNLFTNYFNHVAQTAVDFPAVPLPKPALQRR